MKRRANSSVHLQRVLPPQQQQQQQQPGAIGPIIDRRVPEE